MTEATLQRTMLGNKLLQADKVSLLLRASGTHCILSLVSAVSLRPQNHQFHQLTMCVVYEERVVRASLLDSVVAKSMLDLRSQ